MLVVRVLAHFVYQLLVALLLALVVALLWALARGGGFVHALHVSLYAVGGLVLVMGAIGLGGISPSAGFVGGAGRIPGLKAATHVPPDGTAVNPTAILLVTGAALIAIAAAI